MKQLALAFAIVFLANLSQAQSVYAPLNKDYSHLVDRYEILNGTISNDLHTSFKPYFRDNVYKLAAKTPLDSLVELNRVDSFNIRYLKDDNWEWADSAHLEGNSKKPVFRRFYKKKNALYNFRNDDFDVQVNPVFYVLGGKENGGLSTNFINTRGAEVRGSINRRVGFYSVITTTQALFPNYVRERINTPGLRAVPGEGYFKTYQANGVDYFTARGYVTFKLTKNINFQFGHDRNFIGNGYRSLILSDFSSPYLFAKIQTKIWKIHYTNLYAQMFNNTNVFKDTTYSKKFMTLHHLSINIGRHLNVGLFESIVYTRANNQFDLNYLNPIIFYRYAETYQGSGDKATLGLDFKLNFARRVSIYGQLVLNEFRINEVRNGNGWWGNKQAYQLGFKYIDFAGLKNVDLQFEVNAVRPYTYTSVNGQNNYSHYNQPLAHPMGANFVEVVGVLRVQPQKRIFITGTGILTRVGQSDSTTNFGNNIFTPYDKVPSTRSYGNYITQGVATNIAYAELNISYMLRHNLFIDLTQLFREQFTDKSNPIYRRSTSFSSFSIRYNFGQKQQAF
ncbi:MAG: hypothetical protein H7329_06920 [Opitutaceae bacterium]|nr:hypothetical protein [Cytophagales bacterium]